MTIVHLPVTFVTSYETEGLNTALPMLKLSCLELTACVCMVSHCGKIIPHKS